MKTKLLLMVNLVATISCIALAAKILVMPVIAKAHFSEEYKVLMFQCDNVMRDHMIAKNRVIYEKTDSSIRELKAAEMGLLSCHEYDKQRKVMLSWGLTPNDLSLIGLEAIEENVDDLMDYVEIHEFKY